jgi:hypothetical protein
MEQLLMEQARQAASHAEAQRPGQDLAQPGRWHPRLQTLTHLKQTSLDQRQRQPLAGLAVRATAQAARRLAPADPLGTPTSDRILAGLVPAKHLVHEQLQRNQRTIDPLSIRTHRTGQQVFDLGHTEHLAQRRGPARPKSTTKCSNLLTPTRRLGIVFHTGQSFCVPR